LEQLKLLVENRVLEISHEFRSFAFKAPLDHGEIQHGEVWEHKLVQFFFNFI